MAIDNRKQTTDINDLVGLIVHSYNNYLAGMMGYSEIALLECDNAEIEERLNRSLESGNEAVHFGKTILASLGRLQVPLQDCSLVEIIQSIGEKLPGLITKSDITELANIKIKTDPQWFEECFLDLIEFATSSENGSKPSLKCFVSESGESGEIVSIKIKCAELLLSEQDASQIFDLFFSSRKMSGKKDIGLAKAKGFFNQMNAVLNWENKQGFILEIPVELDT